MLVLVGGLCNGKHGECPRPEAEPAAGEYGTGNLPGPLFFSLRWDKQMTGAQ